MAGIILLEWLTKQVVVSPAIVSSDNNGAHGREQILVRAVEKRCDQLEEFELVEDSLHVAIEAFHDVLVYCLISEGIAELFKERVLTLGQSLELLS